VHLVSAHGEFFLIEFVGTDDLEKDLYFFARSIRARDDEIVMFPRDGDEADW